MAITNETSIDEFVTLIENPSIPHSRISEILHSKHIDTVGDFLTRLKSHGPEGIFGLMGITETLTTRILTALVLHGAWTSGQTKPVQPIHLSGTALLAQIRHEAEAEKRLKNMTSILCVTPTGEEIIFFVDKIVAIHPSGDTSSDIIFAGEDTYTVNIQFDDLKAFFRPTKVRSND